ncbi:hypothetical protein HDU98_003392 [Podochytrium sp. JEL0797]|nr:hypothetical protein HDU98_003392 [Podochytrium sp. JEL0797]
MPVIEIEKVIRSSQYYTPPTFKRTIVIALDSSKSSELAFKHAVKHQIQKDDLVVLIHAQPPLLESHGFFTPTDAATANKAQGDECLEVLKKYSELVEDKKVSYKAISLVGPVKESLVEKVHELRPTILICGSRGAGLISRSLLGSTSDYMARHCDCPVLIVKPSAEESKATKRKSQFLPQFAPVVIPVPKSQQQNQPMLQRMTSF